VSPSLDRSAGAPRGPAPLVTHARRLVSEHKDQPRSRNTQTISKPGSKGASFGLLVFRRGDNPALSDASRSQRLDAPRSKKAESPP
jgi:hypothetical protein